MRVLDACAGQGKPHRFRNANAKAFACKAAGKDAYRTGQDERPTIPLATNPLPSETTNETQTLPVTRKRRLRRLRSSDLDIAVERFSIAKLNAERARKDLVVLLPVASVNHMTAILEATTNGTPVPQGFRPGVDIG